jgi:hypothetical protein
MPRLDHAAIADDVERRTGTRPSLGVMALIVTDLTVRGDCDLTNYYTLKPGRNGILSAADYWTERA